MLSALPRMRDHLDAWGMVAGGSQVGSSCWEASGGWIGGEDAVVDVKMGCWPPVELNSSIKRAATNTTWLACRLDETSSAV